MNKMTEQLTQAIMTQYPCDPGPEGHGVGQRVIEARPLPDHGTARYLRVSGFIPAADAELFVEAHTVALETGLTPRQMQIRLAKLEGGAE